MFLAGNLIRHFPGRMFSTVGAVELSIIRIAGIVMEEFEELMAMIKASRSFSSVPADLAKRFCLHLSEYLTAFTAWERSDKAPVWSRLLACLVSLYFACFALPKHDLSARKPVFDQITKLRQRAMQQSGGRAVLDVFDAEMRTGKFGLPPMDPQQVKILDTSFFLLGRLERIQLVQDLLLDVNHRVTADIQNVCPIHVHTMLTRDNGCHWNAALLDLMSFRPTFEPVQASIEEFRHRLCALADQKKALVDASFAEHAFPLRSVDECLSVLGTIRQLMQKIQMPIRNKEIDAGWDAVFVVGEGVEHVLISALKHTHRVLKAAEIDHHCVRVLLVSRVLNENGAVYIEQKYQKLLRDGSLTMDRTKAWVAAAVQASLENSCVTLAELRQLTITGIVKVLYTGYNSLLFGAVCLNNEHDFPETLLLDVWRLCSLQRKFRVDVAAVAVLSKLNQRLRFAEEGQKRAVLESVALIFMELSYGVRGMDDTEFTFPGVGIKLSLLDRIQSVLLPPGIFVEDIGNYMDVRSREFQCM